METIASFAASAWELLLEQLHPPFWSITSPLYWAHITSALLLAWLVWSLAQRGQPRGSLWAQLQRFRAEHLTRAVYWHRSARVDYAFYFVNGVVFPLMIAPYLLADVVVRSGVERQLSSIFGARGDGPSEPGALLSVLLCAAVFVAYDFGRWLGHFAMHHVPGLWVFHKVHHSAEVLTPITNFRAHPVELAVMVGTTTLTTGSCAGLILFAFPGAGLWETTSLGAAVTLFAFDLGGSLLRHSSVWLSYGPAVGRVLVSPAQHQIHHSTDPIHLGKNLGFALAIWDWIAGTLYVPRQREHLSLGLGDGTEPTYRSVARAYLVPFVELARIVVASVARALAARPKAPVYRS